MCVRVRAPFGHREAGRGRASDVNGTVRLLFIVVFVKELSLIGFVMRSTRKEFGAASCGKRYTRGATGGAGRRVCEPPQSVVVSSGWRLGA